MIETHHALVAITAFASLTVPATARTEIPPLTPEQSAARDEIAYGIVEELTRSIGPRQAGTDAEQKARDWAVQKLQKMGFDNVREESFLMPTWVRGEERAYITNGSIFSPAWIELSVAALGNSASTGEKPLRGQIAYFRTFDEFSGAGDSAVKGKIVFIDHDMSRTQDGSSYGYFGRARFQGPNLAAKKGALAIVVRSVGTANHDHPHTGNTNFEAGVSPIPAAAISNAGADLITKEDIRNREIELILTPKNLGQTKSGNVIAEVTGSNPALPPILIACHLDSWDLGTGAIDDASGCGIIAAAAIHAQSGFGRPKRTIRLLWAGAEEVGIWGGKDYAEKHATTPHALAMESDFGADRVWAVDFNLPESAKALQDQITLQLALLGIVPRKDKAGGGADIGPIIAKQGLGVIDLQQDGTRYFDIHHNATDTIERIDREQLRQNVEAWTIVLKEVANYEGELKPEMKP